MCATASRHPANEGQSFNSPIEIPMGRWYIDLIVLTYIYHKDHTKSANIMILYLGSDLLIYYIDLHLVDF